MAEFIPENWVIFKPGQRKTLHFYDHAMVERVITDPVTKTPKRVKTLVLYVDEEDGVKVEKMLSLLSYSLAQKIAAYIPGKAYTRYKFTIEKPLDKFAKPELVEVTPIR